MYTTILLKQIQDGSHAENWTLDFGEIKAYLDMSNRQTGATLKYKLYEMFNDFEEDLFADCNWPRNLGNLPIRNNYYYGNQDEAYTVYMTPGTIVT